MPASLRDCGAIRVRPFGTVETWKSGGIHLAEDSLKSALEGGDET